MSAIQVKINKQVRHCVMVSLKKKKTLSVYKDIYMP